jgi:glycosyltransferase involved in cell wall biosynthesis
VKDILHVSYAQSGGAGKVAEQLSSTQANMKNYQSRFIYASKTGIRVKPFDNFTLTTRAIFDELIIKQKNWSSLISVLRTTQDNRINQSIIDHNGIVHLHWLSGIIMLENLLSYQNKGKKLIWTIHDMEPFTGGCHYALDCDNFEGTCNSCPAVRGVFRNNIELTKIRKNTIYSQLDKLICVFPSKWMLNNFEKSIPQKTANLAIIPNPLPGIYFEPIKKGAIEKSSSEILTLGFVAQNLNDPIKQFTIVIEVIQKLSFLIETPIKLIAVGQKFRGLSKRLNFEVFQPGRISNPLDLRELYLKMDLLISNSKSESFGLTIAEAAACGVPSLVLEGSGSSEQVINNETGLIFKDATDLVRKILFFVDNPEVRYKFQNKARDYSLEQWHIENIASKYNSLYDRL